MGKKRRQKGKTTASGSKTRPADEAPAASSTSHEGGAAAVAGFSEAEVEWPEDEEAQQKLLTAIKFRTLAPFLFGQKTLSLEAELCAVEANLLPRDEGVWPAFFEENQWRTAVLVVQVVITSSHLCETNQSFRDYLLKGKSAVLKDTSMVAKLLKLHSKMMAEYSTAEVEVTYKVLRLQVMSLGVVGVSSPAYLFLEGLQDKEQLVLPIKERGNTNFRDGRYRAAIGDYTRAIRIFPYSAVLYSNRSLCHLKNGDSWRACVDSFRSLVLSPDWEKPYYRCCQAWMLLGNHAVALKLNSMGQDMCKSTSDLCRQKEEIVVAMENSQSDGQTPPTDPSHQSSLTTGDRTKKLSSKARKKERKQRGRGQRSTVSDSAHSSEVEGGVGVNSGDVAMATQPAGDEEYGSDLEDITEQLLNHNGGATGETKAEDKESEIDPLEEDDDDWEFQHTSSKRMPSWQQSRKGGGEVCEEEEESDQEEYVRPERDQPDPEEEASVAARREEKEMADFRRREKERERMREERKAMRTVEERKMARAVPIPNPYTQFEQLHVPTLHVETSTDQLFKMIKTVPSRQMVARQYTAHSEAWRSLEPLPPLRPPIIPKPPATTLTAKFDEVWCPMLAGVWETADIIPPRIHYVGNMVTKYIPHYPPHYHRYEF